MVSVKMIQRCLGLVSILILARILTPDDFGIVAIASLTVGLFQILSFSGSIQYIIQKVNVDDADLNCAWTIDIILKGILWIVLIFSVPFIEDFLGQGLIAPALWVLSVTLVIEACQNPGLILYRKHLEYKKLFYIGLAERLASFFVIVMLAFVTKSYWAMIVGQVTQSLVGLIGSFIIHSYRPKFSLLRFKEQWAFSKWMLLKGCLGYARSYIDNIFVSKLFGKSDIGRYHLSKDISLMPYTEIIIPMTEPLLASFAKVKQNSQSLAYQIRLSLLIVVLITTPICVFMWCFPESIVDVLLGSNWSSTYSLFSYFSILLFTACAGMVFTHCLVVLGKVKSIFLYDLFSLIFIAVGLLALMPNTLEWFAINRSLLQILTWLVLVFIAAYYTKFSVTLATVLCLPAFFSAYIAAQSTKLIVTYEALFPLLALIYNTVVFFTVYGICLMAFYFLYYKRFEEARKVKELVQISFNAVASKIFKNKKTSEA